MGLMIDMALMAGIDVQLLNVDTIDGATDRTDCTELHRLRASQLAISVRRDFNV